MQQFILIFSLVTILLQPAYSEWVQYFFIPSAAEKGDQNVNNQVISGQWLFNPGFEPSSNIITKAYDPNYYEPDFLGNTPQRAATNTPYKNNGLTVIYNSGLHLPYDFNQAYNSDHGQVQISNMSMNWDANAHVLHYSFTLNVVNLNPGNEAFFVGLLLQVVKDQEATHDIYTDALTRGQNNFFLTGDGEQLHTTVNFSSDNAKFGSKAIEVYTSQDSYQGTHWKLMLFENGSGPWVKGEDLTGYQYIEFYMKGSRFMQILGAFGTGEDTAVRGFGALQVTTTYQKYSIPIGNLNLSDINTPFWIYLHKDLNPFDFSGTRLWIDQIRLVK